MKRVLSQLFLVMTILFLSGCALDSEPGDQQTGIRQPDEAKVTEADRRACHRRGYGKSPAEEWSNGRCPLFIDRHTGNRESGKAGSTVWSGSITLYKRSVTGRQ